MIPVDKSKQKEDSECAKVRRELDSALRELQEKEAQTIELDRIAKMLVRRDMEIIRLNDELVEIDRAKSHFTTIAAHQLRTPLSVVKWTLRMLLSEDFGSLNDEQKRVIEGGYNVNEGMIKLISDLLDVARIESGRFTYKFEKVFIEDVIIQVTAALKTRADEKEIRIEVTRGAGRDLAVLGDKTALKVAVDNLVANAINYTLPGGKIDIGYKQDGQYIAVTIKDTGIGVPAHQKNYLFAKFFRGDNVVKMQTSGSGLGLFITKSIINAHSGEIGVDSQEGQGSTFWFKLPIDINT